MARACQNGGSLSIGELRQQGIEPTAIAVFAADWHRGSGRAMRRPGCRCSWFGYQPVWSRHSKFDPAELARLNAMIIKDLPFDAVQGRLAAAGVGGDALFWDTVR